MSTRAQAILEEIQELSPADLRELRQQINQMVEEAEQSSSPPARVSDEEFGAALDEVTGCTDGSNGLQRLLEDRRLDRERASLALQPSAR